MVLQSAAPARDNKQVERMEEDLLDVDMKSHVPLHVAPCAASPGACRRMVRRMASTALLTNSTRRCQMRLRAA
jgi:hypothetical protein